MVEENATISEFEVNADVSLSLVQRSKPETVIKVNSEITELRVKVLGIDIVQEGTNSNEEPSEEQKQKNELEYINTKDNENNLPKFSSSQKTVDYFKKHLKYLKPFQKSTRTKSSPSTSAISAIAWRSYYINKEKEKEEKETIKKRRREQYESKKLEKSSKNKKNQKPKKWMGLGRNKNVVRVMMN